MTKKAKETIEKRKDRMSTEWARQIKHLLEMIESAKRIDNSMYIDNLYDILKFAEFQYDQNKRV